MRNLETKSSSCGSSSGRRPTGFDVGCFTSEAVINLLLALPIDVDEKPEGIGIGKSDCTIIIESPF